MQHARTAMPDWERYLWMVLLGPVFWLQARYVRRVTPRLPEPPGARSGMSGSGPLVRLLVAGDSAAAGVGAASQDEALCGQLVSLLSEHNTVQWQLMAVNGLDSPALVQLLEDAPRDAFDVVIISMGGNDVSGLVAPRDWAIAALIPGCWCTAQPLLCMPLPPFRSHCAGFPGAGRMK
jgi:hypothetical protein